MSAQMHHHPRRSRSGFSLIEVTISLAIIAFALLPMVALLPVGMNSYSNAATRGRAVQVVGQIATCMQLATSPASGATLSYTALAPFSTTTPAIQWVAPGTTSVKTFGPYYFDGAGNLLANNASGNARFIGVVAISAATAASGSDPAASMNPPSATITVAWPATAAYTWSGVVPQFTGIQGHEESTIPLSPTFQ